jgi:hypothetical protein
LLLDETDPVRGNIEIDERRSISGDDREQDPNE